MTTVNAFFYRTIRVKGRKRIESKHVYQVELDANPANSLGMLMELRKHAPNGPDWHIGGFCISPPTKEDATNGSF